MAYHYGDGGALPRQLQWGHGREAMDGGARLDIAINRTMLQWGHGREAMDGRTARAYSAPASCFNGAMAVRPWMARSTAMYPSPATSFNGAMAVRPWMACRNTRRAPRRSWLQWGHGREAMDGARRRRRNRLWPASMGPWP